MTDDEIRKLHPLDRRRILWATERRYRDNPLWSKSEAELIAAKLRDEMREEIAAATKPKRQRRRSVESYARTVVKTGVTITTPDGETISKSNGAEHEMSDDLRKLI